MQLTNHKKSHAWKIRFHKMFHVLSHSFQLLFLGNGKMASHEEVLFMKFIKNGAFANPGKIIKRNFLLTSNDHIRFSLW